MWKRQVIPQYSYENILGFGGTFESKDHALRTTALDDGLKMKAAVIL